VGLRGIKTRARQGKGAKHQINALSSVRPRNASRVNLLPGSSPSLQPVIARIRGSGAPGPARTTSAAAPADANNLGSAVFCRRLSEHVSGPRPECCAVGLATFWRVYGMNREPLHHVQFARRSIEPMTTERWLDRASFALSSRRMVTSAFSGPPRSRNLCVEILCSSG